MDTISKEVIDKISPLLSKKNVEVDIDEELANLAKRQLKIHIAKELKKAKKKLSQYRCSKCGRTGHNSRNCKNKKKSRSKSKSNKKGNVNLATVNSSSKTESD